MENLMDNVFILGRKGLNFKEDTRTIQDKVWVNFIILPIYFRSVTGKKELKAGISKSFLRIP